MQTRRRRIDVIAAFMILLTAWFKWVVVYSRDEVILLVFRLTKVLFSLFWDFLSIQLRRLWPLLPLGLSKPKDEWMSVGMRAPCFIFLYSDSQSDIQFGYQPGIPKKWWWRIPWVNMTALSPHTMLSFLPTHSLLSHSHFHRNLENKALSATLLQTSRQLLTS